MASQPRMSERIAFDLDVITAEVADLPATVADWDQWPESSQTTFHLEWGNTMGGVKLLDRAYHSGQMTPDQQACYRDLLGKLRDVLPIIRKLNLSHPPIRLEV